MHQNKLKQNKFKKHQSPRIPDQIELFCNYSYYIRTKFIFGSAKKGYHKPFFYNPESIKYSEAPRQLARPGNST